MLLPSYLSVLAAEAAKDPTVNWGDVIGIATFIAGFVLGLLKFVAWLGERSKNGRNGKPIHWVDDKGENRILLRAEFDAGMADMERKLREIQKISVEQGLILNQLLEYAKTQDKLHDIKDADGIPVWYFSQSLKKTIYNTAELFEKESDLLITTVDKLDKIYDVILQSNTKRSR